MTREEALQILDTIPTIGEQVDALEMAIKALSQEPCDDAISRKAVYSILNEYHIGEEEIDSAMDECQNLTVNAITSDVSLLPSVTQKSGKWIWSDEIDRYVCDKCGQSDGKDKEMVESGEYSLSNYCPNCGAKMESEDKE